MTDSRRNRFPTVRFLYDDMGGFRISDTKRIPGFDSSDAFSILVNLWLGCCVATSPEVSPTSIKLASRKLKEELPELVKAYRTGGYDRAMHMAIHSYGLGKKEIDILTFRKMNNTWVPMERDAIMTPAFMKLCIACIGGQFDIWESVCTKLDDVIHDSRKLQVENGVAHIEYKF